jgi:hypothetical protein
MKKLYQDKAMAYYGQIALFDTEDKDSYPQWPDGKASHVFGPKGVAVAALIDNWIELEVYEELIPANKVFYGSGEINIGNSGVTVGNVIANTIGNIAWPPGKLKVEIYANGIEDKATWICFVIKKA